MKYTITQVREEGFIPCYIPFGDLETNDIENDMQSFAEWLGETASYSLEKMNVKDDYGNEFKFEKVKS